MARRARQILAFIAIGAVINILVAWGCALWIDGAPVRRTPLRGVSRPTHPRWDINWSVIQPGAGVIIFDSFIPVAPRPPDMNATATEIQHWIEAKQRYDAGLPPLDDDRVVVSVPRWSRASSPPEPEELDRLEFLEDARGWPLLSMMSVQRDRRIAGTQTSSMSANLWQMRLPSMGVQGALGLPRSLPLKPMGLGFAVNTLLYAAILYVPFKVISALRRRRRVVRKLCTACGYPIGASKQCSECGAIVSRTP